jgi:hypothetical protein
LLKQLHHSGRHNALAKFVTHPRTLRTHHKRPTASRNSSRQKPRPIRPLVLSTVNAFTKPTQNFDCPDSRRSPTNKGQIHRATNNNRVAKTPNAAP